MAEQKPQITLPEDPVIRAEIERLLKGASPDSLSKDLAKKVKAPPRYVFSDIGMQRLVDTHVQVSNGFEQRGGIIIRKLSDAASLVLVDGHELVVHEPEEAWGQ